MADIEFSGESVPAEVLERWWELPSEAPALGSHIDHIAGYLPEYQNGRSILNDMLRLQEQIANKKEHRMMDLGIKLAGLGLSSALVGASFASTDVFRTPSKTTVGPGVGVEYTPTHDSALTIKTAFGADIVKPFPLEQTHGVGAKAEITSLPDLKKLGLSNLGESDQQAAIWSSLLGDSDHILAQAKRGAWNHWLGLFEFGSGLTLALELGGAFFLERRKHERTHWSPAFKMLAGVVGGTVLMTSVNFNLVDQKAYERARVQPADTLFDGVPFLEGSHLSGTLNEEIRPVLTRFADTLRANAKFYKTLQKNLDIALQTQAVLRATPGHRVMEVIANGHCDFYTHSIDRTIADYVGASTIGITSDMVIGGIPAVDQACLDSLAFNLSGLDVAYIDGNHTDPGLLDYVRRFGWVVIGDTPTLISGWRYIGASDQHRSEIGSSIQQIGSSNLAVAIDLDQKACAAGGVDIIMTAEEDMAQPTLADNCAQLGIYGSREAAVSWVMSKSGLMVPQIRGANSGGVSDDKVTLANTLQAPATVVLFEGQEAPFAPEAVQVITEHEDATVTIGPIINLRPAGEATATVSNAH